MLVLYTDLDGTLLERETHAYRAAAPALDELKRLDVPVVFSTSKTRAEVDVWRRVLGNTHPFIVENGGAVFIPEEYFPLPETWVSRGGYRVIELGAPHAEVLAALRRAASESHCPVRGFADMHFEEISRRCGLSLEEARAASAREYDEPFEIREPARTGELLRAIEALGMRWTRGDQWYHITGGSSGKDHAVKALTALYGRAYGSVVSIGLGDGLNDARFLRAVDASWIVRSPFSAPLKRLVPQGTVTHGVGPEGWNEAVWEALRQFSGAIGSSRPHTLAADAPR